MRVPLSWLKDFVDITISAELLAERLTLAGLEVAKIEYVGVPQGEAPAGINVPPSDHLVWDRDKIVLGAIREVLPHPNADKLILAMVDHGTGALEQVVTGAPNIFQYRGQGPLNPPLWTALAREGAEVFDGHSEEVKRMILKERNLRGIPNKCMVCSAKELGMPDIVDGIILIDDPGLAPGTPFVEVMGDVVLDIELTPNLARCYSILGVAREAAALTGQTVREPEYHVAMTGPAIEGQVSIQIEDSALNPRFTAMLIKDVTIKPSPEWVQRRLIAAGERPINNVVDVTNYVMLETGQPLHAFDFDFLIARAKGSAPKIITRPAKADETTRTLDGLEHTLEDFNELVCDTEGILSIAGIMGGDESKIQDTTRNVLLEAANWNYINIRKTMFTQKMASGAGLRFSRGVHPAMAERGLRRGMRMLLEVAGGSVANGILDEYPLPPPAIQIDLPLTEIKRLLGVAISAEDATQILTRLQFGVAVDADTLHISVPDHRTDIGTGTIGQADICEEIARIYGYDRLPNTLIADLLPVQSNNDEISREEAARDLLVRLGLHEAINYRLTTPEAEARLNAPNLPSAVPDVAYVALANPISLDKTVLRHTILNSVLENVVANQNHSARQALYEIGAVFLPVAGQHLPAEPRRIAIAMCGARQVPTWQDGAHGSGPAKGPAQVDFYDLKGVIEAFIGGLHAGAPVFKPAQQSPFHPGRCAAVYAGAQRVGVMGELHPVVHDRYDLQMPVFLAELDLDLLLGLASDSFRVTAIPTQPAIYQDIAVVLNADVPAADVQNTIVQAGGDLLVSVALFDVYRGEPIPIGKKSLAYALVYRAEDRTLTDKDAAKVQQRIVAALQHDYGAELRS
jgi:phenylalanyl-tRNA synthetase beta chain